MATNFAEAGKTGKMLGARVRRVEDPRLLLGKGRYVDDIQLPGVLALAFVRSSYAHARLEHVDVSAAKMHPGVVAVLTGADIIGVIKPLRVQYDPAKAPNNKPCDWPVLALGKVRFVGKPLLLSLRLTNTLPKMLRHWWTSSMSLSMPCGMSRKHSKMEPRLCTKNGATM